MSEQKNWYDDDSDQTSDSGDSKSPHYGDGDNGQSNWYTENSDDYVKSGSYNYDSQYNHNSNQYYGRPANTQGTNQRFGGAAFGCGIASIATLFTGVLSVGIGALGILFVNLSKRRGKAILPRAKAGMVMSIIGIVLGGIITFNSLLLMYTMVKDGSFYDTYYNEFNESYKMIYGEDMDREEFEQMFNLFGSD